MSWSKEAYKIGGIFAITGPSSFLGDPEKKSMEMVVDEINAQGGIDGHPLEAVIYDTEGDPTKTVLATNKLISKDNVLAIVGPSLTPDDPGHCADCGKREDPPDQLCCRDQDHRTDQTLGVQDGPERRPGRGRHLPAHAKAEYQEDRDSNGRECLR